VNRSLLGVLSVVVATAIATPASAQTSMLETPVEVDRPHRSPDWTWAVLGIGGGLVVAGLGTGAGVLVIQGELDQVCMLTCPSSHAELQRAGRALAISTDVLWLSGIVLAGFGLAAALALDEEVALDEPSPPSDVALTVLGGCDTTGCSVGLEGRF
jgi:hypothetical protein